MAWLASQLLKFYRAWVVLQVEGKLLKKAMSGTYHHYDNNCADQNSEGLIVKIGEASWLLIALKNIYTDNQKLEFVTIQLKTLVENQEDSMAKFNESLISPLHKRVAEEQEQF